MQDQFREHYVLSQHPDFVAVMNWVGSFPLRCDIHLNRTRFWVPLGPTYTEFVLRWGDVCPLVED